MSNKKSHREQERKRREKLEERANIEAFRLKVELRIRNRFPELSFEHPAVAAEVEAICAAGLIEGMNTLGEIITSLRTEMGVSPLADKGSLTGSVVSYVLGITMDNPLENGKLNNALIAAAGTTPPVHVQIYFDSDVRNQVAAWVKTRFPHLTASTLLGQPVFKLPKMIVEFRRDIKLS